MYDEACTWQLQKGSSSRHISQELKLREVDQSSMAMANPSYKPIRTCTILKEAIVLPKKNPSLISSVFLISFLITYLLFLAIELSVFRLLTDLANVSTSIITADPTSPAYSRLLDALKKDVREILAVEVVAFIISMIITYAVTTMNMYALAMTYVGELLTLKQLLCNVKGMLKGPIVTQLLATLLNGGFVVLLFLLVFLFWYISNGSIPLIALVGLLALAAVVLFFYLTVLFTLSIMVSVVEQGCYGVGAIARAAELIKGNAWQGIAIIVLTNVLSTPVVVIQQLIHLSLWGQIGVGLVYVLVLQVLSFFLLAAFAVYYYECKRSHGEGAAHMASKVVYTSLPTTSVDVA